MNIPNINDNPLYYATLQSGVVPSSEMYNNEALGVGFGDRQQMSGMNINGGEVGNNDVQVDGLSVQGAAWHESTNCPIATPSRKSPSRPTACRASWRGLGVIQMATKSGTNQFHGDLAYRMRNEAFNANGTSNDVQDIPKGKYRLNEESGAVGGPSVSPTSSMAETKCSSLPHTVATPTLPPQVDTARFPRLSSAQETSAPLS